MTVAKRKPGQPVAIDIASERFRYPVVHQVRPRSMLPPFIVATGGTLLFRHVRAGYPNRVVHDPFPSLDHRKSVLRPGVFNRARDNVERITYAKARFLVISILPAFAIRVCRREKAITNRRCSKVGGRPSRTNGVETHSPV
jgi:hypothetical protein